MSSDHDPREVLEALRPLPHEPGALDPVRNHRRRTVIRYLARIPADETVEVAEFARVSAALSEDVSYGAVTNSDYRREYQGLRGRDITQLAISGVVDRDDDGTIGRGEAFETYATVVDALDETLPATRADGQ